MFTQVEFSSLVSRKVAVSDLARVALMARYGGIYVDADLLVAVHAYIHVHCMHPYACASMSTRTSK